MRMHTVFVSRWDERAPRGPTRNADQWIKRLNNRASDGYGGIATAQVKSCNIHGTIILVVLTIRVTNECLHYNTVFCNKSEPQVL